MNNMLEQVDIPVKFQGVSNYLMKTVMASEARQSFKVLPVLKRDYHALIAIMGISRNHKELPAII